MSQLYSPKSRRLLQGFTLVEVLVALSIFAILALAGWKVFDALIKVRERNQIHTERLSTLQSTYALMLRDFGQLVARPARQSGQTEPALVIENDKIVFTRTGAFDPTGRSSSNLERVTYQYDAGQQRLIRTSYRNPDQARLQTPPMSVLLVKISNFSVQALEPAETDRWPSAAELAKPSEGTQPEGDDRLPLGLQMQFMQDEQPILWRFNLVKKLPENVGASEQMAQPGNNNNSNSNGQ
ncbi:type II secretion system minor pseudopilin GspJ [Alkanindiges sp. WGS2144]|uniref:type II secretion system minor pseudopilin GspJ n=1 Tax=Alkanindiges sp. WGS2144 TaxID=3366808 RepID=UPI003752EFCE